jgi:hypothetical protein
VGRVFYEGGRGLVVKDFSTGEGEEATPASLISGIGPRKNGFQNLPKTKTIVNVGYIFLKY